MESPQSVHQEVLPNGLVILLRESHSEPVADIQIWTRVGSADERSSESGLAHFHEHMLFKGTERRGVGAVAGEIEGAGGRVNAYTSFDATVYFATLPSSVLHTGLDVLVDAARNSIFDPSEIKREIEVVLEEIRRSEDSPVHALSEAVFREHYREHPYRAPILGSAKSVASFDREKITTFWKRWYTPDNMVVVAAGDFDANELAAEIRARFADAEPGHASHERVVEPVQTALRPLILPRAFESLRVDLAWPGTRFRDDDATYLELLSFILGEAESSRLVRRVRENEGLVDRIDSSSYTPLDPGVFSINLEVDTARLSEAIRAAVREVERLRVELVGDEELERARANYLASEHFERESVSGLASKIGNFQVLGGDWRSEERYFEVLRAATAQDLLRVAQKYLGPEQLTAGVLLPEADAHALDEGALVAAVESGVSDCRKSFVPPTRSPSPSRASRAPAIESFRFDNGVGLHVLPRRDVPVVAVRAACLGGLLAETQSSAGISHFLASAWMRGTQSHSSADYARSVENIAAEIDGFSGRSSLGVTLEVTSEKLEEALDLYTEVLLEPGLFVDDVNRERRETLAAIDRQEDQLAQLAFRLFAKTHFDAHPYRLPIIGTRESVESFSSDQLHAFHHMLVAGENLVVAVAGDVDPDRIAAALSNRLGGLPTGESFRVSIPAEDNTPSEIRRAHIEKDRAQAHLLLGFRGLRIDDPERHTLEVISQLLAGQSGRLFLELRDRRSLAYTVSAMNVEGLSPGFFAVYIATAPEKLGEARRGMLTELERLIAEPPADDELAHAKRNLAGNRAIDQQRNASHAGRMALDALYGLGADESWRYIEAVEAVQKEDVLRVARRIIQLDAYTEALVAP